MFSVNRNSRARNFPAPRPKSLPTALRFAFTTFALRWHSSALPSTYAQQIRKPPKGGVAELSSSGPQSRQGDITTADGAVDIHYGNQRLRADHVEYNDQTDEAVARGHIIFDYENQHLEADEAHFNVSTGRGTFTNVRGFIKIERKPNPTVLITENPLYFEAKNVEKYNNDLYILSSAWITVCDPEHPRWQFFAQHARVTVDKKVALVNSNFRLRQNPARLASLRHRSRRNKSSRIRLPHPHHRQQQQQRCGARRRVLLGAHAMARHHGRRRIPQPPRLRRARPFPRQAMGKHFDQLQLFRRDRSRRADGHQSRPAHANHRARFTRWSRAAGRSHFQSQT